MIFKQSKETGSIVIDVRKLLHLFWELKNIYCLFIIIGLLVGYAISYTLKPTYLNTIQIKLPEYTSGSTGNTIAKIAKSDGFISDILNDHNNNDNSIVIEAKMIRETSILQIIISGQNKYDLDQFIEKYKKQIIKKIEPIANEIIIRDLEEYNLMGGSPLSMKEITQSQVIVKPQIVNTSDTIIKVSRYKRSIIGGISGFLLAFIYMIIRYAKR
ncbi:Wzz/FepE/Etk N-terminal domain-containing protein [Catenibacterium sp.]|uniref:Wzz/FepE/Etk N-terminal domain-containing protein n=1 Tax=Catenibacterium sp. TaxID=2049022 RepID=UPI004026B953